MKGEEEGEEGVEEKRGSKKRGGGGGREEEEGEEETNTIQADTPDEPRLVLPFLHSLVHTQLHEFQ